jgi:Uma2 family endonuclease
MTATTSAPTLTFDEFVRRHGDESGIELVDGQIVRLDMPGGDHGEVCLTAGSMIRDHVKARKLGRVMSNDTFIRTKAERCRGADICYVSYATMPADVPTPKGPLTPPLDLVVEVKSPTDSYREVSEKAFEYLDAGVKLVLVLDPETESAGVYRPNELPQRFHNGDTVTLPDVLPEFAVPVKSFFE